MSNSSKRADLYERLFKSIKASLGIDAEVEPEDIIRAFYEGKYDLTTMELVVHFRYCKSKDDFLKGYPQELRDHLWELCGESSKIE